MGPALLTGAIVATACLLAVWVNSLRLQEWISNEHRRRLLRRQLAGSGLGGFAGGTATGLTLIAVNSSRLGDFALLGGMLGLTGAVGLTLLYNRPTTSEPRQHFQEAFLGALAFSGPWCVLFVCVVCR